MTLPLQAVTFPSRASLEIALYPLTLEEVVQRVAKSSASLKLSLDYLNAPVIDKKVIPLRNPGCGNLLRTEIYKTKHLTVYYPENPRVPHHLTIALNRRTIKGFSSISEAENAELYGTIKKVAEIYKNIGVQGFVLAQYDTPQEGHAGYFVAEIIPHLPGFKDVKNTVDKLDCNRHVLFRTANLTPIKYENNDIAGQAAYWQDAFKKESQPLASKDLTLSFPYIRLESHHAEAEKVLYHQLIELLQDKGGHSEEPCFQAEMPEEVNGPVKTVNAAKCFFCDKEVIKRQFVYEYEDILVFYNVRKGAKEGSFFLLLPKRHTEKIYGLSSKEIQNLCTVRKALAELLKEADPGCEVIVYTQDDPAIGQTVFHMHEQVIAADPKTIALTWTMMSLYPAENVSEEEMRRVCQEFGTKLQQKLKDVLLEEVI
jgi:histidine triad (HIT) family protein